MQDKKSNQRALVELLGNIAWIDLIQLNDSEYTFRGNYRVEEIIGKIRGNLNREGFVWCFDLKVTATISRNGNDLAELDMSSNDLILRLL